MRWCRSRLVPCVAALAALLSTTFAQQPPSSPPPPKESAPAAKPDPAASKLLDQAIEKTDPKQMGWLKTTLWQQLDVQGLTFEAQGTYLLGPNRQMRLDLKLQVGGAEGSLLQVSDGKTLWDVTRIGTQPATVAKVDLTKVLDVLGSPNLLEMREQFFQGQSFAGVQPLLNALRGQMVFTQKQDGSWRGKPVYMLTGSWKEARGDIKNWPDALPRHSRLYLDRETLWPHRLEWWGPAGGRKEDVLLMQVEFRDPEHPPKLPAKEFVFDPGPLGVEVQDKTAAFVDSAKRLSRMPGAGAPKR
jgi:hypothetical protein